LEFPGAPYPFHWSLADLELADTPQDLAELRLESGGPVMVRAPLGNARHRLISNAPDVLTRVPASWKPGRVLWKSDFTVSHRMVAHRGQGRVRLVGDAAHIHSPAGGWGMNLGIEDAVTLVRALAEDGPLEDWERTQQRHAARVVRASDALQRLATNQGFLGRTLFPTLVGWLSRIPPIHDYLIGRMAGLH
jgi:2-polyprenyl-6-methoxyphenol hydroxylase-like FAD-dependent oxidoreductase